MSYTPQQQAAVEAPVSNLLVTAAAGSGKTHVLTSRVIRRITHPEHPVDVDRLLIATFTKAAAAEMRERINRAITEELIKNPEDKRLKRQLPLLANASISTIDAFCQRIVREFYYRLGIDPSFGILSGADEELLRAEALDRTMEHLYREQDADFLELCRVFGSALNDKGAEDAILRAYRFFFAHPSPSAEMARAIRLYEDVNEEEIKSIIFDARNKAVDIKNLAAAAANECESGRVKKQLLNIADWADEAIGLPDEEIAMRMSELPVKPVSTAQEVTARDKVVYEKTAKKIRARLKEIRAAAGVSRDGERLRRRELLPVVRGLCRAVCRLEEAMKEEKAARNVWTFSDIARMCLSLLNGAAPEEEPYPSEVAKEIAARYDEIYIDEYQDSDNIQEWIFRLVSGEWEGRPNIFMVGDLKQSIYRFRRSNPLLFREKKETYEDREDAPCRKIELSKNFRSRREVIEGVNALFRPIMSKEVGDVDYRGGEELVFGAENYDPSLGEQNRCELLLLDMSAEGDVGERKMDSTELEAVMIGKRIRELIESGQTVYDKEKKCTRPIKYRDVAILLRGRGREQARLAAVRSVFEEMGIPVYAKEEGGFYDSLEIRTFYAALSVVDNPRQDIPLAALLRSPMVHMSEEELARIRLGERYVGFYDAILSYAGQEDALGEKCRSFLERLQNWRECARRMPVDEFVAYLLEESGWMAFVGALPGGDLRQMNLNIFHQNAMRFVEMTGGGLYRFLRGIEKSRKMNKDRSSARRVEGEMNVVNVMTVHGSKGLEFPIVFVAFLGHNWNKKEETEPMILHPQGGIGLQFVDGRGIRYGNYLYHTVAEAIRKDTTSEEMRILYVAVTRAREKLILTGHVKNAAEKIEEWRNTSLTEAEEVRGASNYLGWFGPAIAKADGAFWIRTVPKGSLLPTGGNEVCALAEEMEEETEKRVDEALSYEYPYRPLAAIAPLFTVTELKGLAAREEDDRSDSIFAKPAFSPLRGTEESKMTAARRGTVWHFVMQHLDLSERDVEKELSRMVEKELLSEEEAKEVDIRAIERFLESPLADRMRRAEKLYRESPFMMRLSCREIPGMEAGREEYVVVQGIIDCWFEEEDKVVIVDYKTDRTGDVQEIKKRYEVQMNLYEKALSLKKMKKSSEKFIYLFYNGDIVEM